jgi:hypothetical protein
MDVPHFAARRCSASAIAASGCGSYRDSERQHFCQDFTGLVCDELGDRFPRPFSEHGIDLLKASGILGATGCEGSRQRVSVNCVHRVAPTCIE